MTMEEFEVRSLLQATGVEIAITAAEAAWQREDVVRNNVYAALQAVMTLWELPLVVGQTKRQPRLRRAAFLDGRPNTFAVSTPADVKYRYRPLTTQATHTMVQEVVEHNAGFADSALGTDGPVSALLESQGAVEPLLVALDDAAAIAPLPDLQDLAATAAKAAVQLITVFTDVSQMRAIYGQDTARAIVNTHPALVVLPGGHDPATAELVDRMVGDEPVPGLTGSGAASERVRRLPWGTALFVSTNRPATVVELRSSVVDRDLLRHRSERPDGLLRRVTQLVPGSAGRRRP
jgi:type IV secretory pathway TraG/TraD family ATPase VirD4